MVLSTEVIALHGWHNLWSSSMAIDYNSWMEAFPLRTPPPLPKPTYFGQASFINLANRVTSGKSNLLPWLNCGLRRVKFLHIEPRHAWHVFVESSVFYTRALLRWWNIISLTSKLTNDIIIMNALEGLSPFPIPLTAINVNNAWCCCLDTTSAATINIYLGQSVIFHYLPLSK